MKEQKLTKNRTPLDVLSFPFFGEAHIVVDLLMLTSLWILAVIIVNPYGNFPLNDDWEYAKPVKQLLETGIFRPFQYSTSPTQIIQVLWGALFCIVFGFSFTVLRFSTLTLALIAVLGIYLLVKQLIFSRHIAFIAALSIAANPIFFVLSFTFMTEIPFLAFTILALLFLIRRLQTESNIWLVLGTFFTTCSIMCRQVGLFIPIAFSIAFIAKKGISLKSVLQAGLPIIIGFWTFIGFKSCIVVKFCTFKILMNCIVVNFPSRSWTRHLDMIMYLGLSLAPLMIFVPQAFRLRRKLVMLLSGVVFALFVIVILSTTVGEDRYMPVIGNVLNKGGVGPVTLYDRFVAGFQRGPRLPLSFWKIITSVGIICGGFLVIHIVCLISKNLCLSHRPRSKDNKYVVFFAVISCLIYIVPFIIIDLLFDRYLLPLMLLLGVAIVASMERSYSYHKLLSILAAVFIICMYSIFSIMATRDYLAWNRTRWEAIEELVEHDNVPTSDIDGGWEFNGWCRSWPNVGENKYIVTMGSIDGYEVIQEYRFKLWLPPYDASICVLRREYDNITD